MQFLLFYWLYLRCCCRCKVEKIAPYAVLVLAFSGGSVGLSKDSVILLEQIRTIDKKRLREHMGHLDEVQMSMVDDAIAVSFGLSDSRPT